MSGSGGGGSTTSKMEPPDFAKPALTSYLDRATTLSNQPVQQFQGPRLAGFSAPQMQGFGMVMNRAANGSPDINASRDQLTKTMRGDFLGNSPAFNPEYNENPFLKGVIQNSMDDVSRQFSNTIMPQTDARAQRMGAFGGSAWQNMQGENSRMLANELGRTAGGMRFQDYSQDIDRKQNAFAQERGNQLRGMMFAPQLAESDYRDAQAMLGVGDVFREFNQDQINLGYQDFLDQRNSPYQQLDVLGNAARSMLGAGGTSTAQNNSGMRTNRASGAIGGGLAGAQMGSMFGPWGTAIGGGLGALGGLLG